MSNRPCVFEHENCIIVEFTPDGKDGRSVVGKGEWDSETEYIFDDLVSYQGSSYIALKTVPVGTLPTDTEYWMVNASGNTVPWGNIVGTLADQTDLKDALDLKADADTVYTKTEADALLAQKADASTVYTKTETNTLLSAKADASTVYTKTETDTLLSAKADSADVYTKTETDTLLSAKADSADVYTKSETNTLLDAKANTADLGDLATQDSVDYDTQVTNKPDLGALAGLDSISYTSNYLTDKPTLGALASKDTVDYSTEVTNKPTLGTMSAVNDAPSDNKQYARKNGAWAEVTGGSGGGSWGSITGTLSDQTDLQTALDNKADGIVSSASGSIASFSDGAPYPVTALSVGVEPVQSGSGDPAPDNVRPISGHASATVTRTGKVVGEWNYTVNNNGNYSISLTAQYYPTQRQAILDLLNGLKPGTYNVGVLLSNCGSNDRVGIRIRYTDGTNLWIDIVQGQGDRNSWNNSNTITIPEGLKDKTLQDMTLYFGQGSSGAPASADFGPIKLSPTAFVPEQSDTYQVTSATIPFGSTVYGGTLDVVGRRLTVDRVLTKFWEVSDIQQSSQTVDGYLYVLRPDNRSSWASDAAYTVIFSAHIKGIAPAEISTTPAGHASLYIAGTNRQLWATSTATSVEAFRTECQTNQAEACIYVTPTVIENLTDAQISTLLGQNVIWADTGDIQNVQYRADTKLFIERLTQPSEDDMVANANIASGKFFMVGNNLFYSTASIASGDAIVPGTNCTALSLADALNNLNA